jgi:predicted nucleic acid-binding protein
MVVVDSSVVLDLLLGTPAAALVRRRLFRPPETLCAPDLLDSEIVRVLARYAQVGAISRERGAAALRDLADLRILRYPSWILWGRTWELQEVAAPGDAVYLSLAEALEAPLVTRDARLRAVGGHGAEVEVLEEPGSP